MSLAYAPPLTTKQKPPAKPDAKLDAPPGYQPGFEVPSIHTLISHSYLRSVPPISYQRMSTRQFLALPETNLKCEWVQGWAILMAPEYSLNNVVLAEIAFRIKRAFPKAIVLQHSGLDLGYASKREPDLAVYGHSVQNAPYPSDLPILVAEVLSKSTRHSDLVVKRGEYANRGIAHYWIVDAEARWIKVLELVAGEYLEVQLINEENPEADLEIDGLGKLRIDLAEVIP